MIYWTVKSVSNPSRIQGYYPVGTHFVRPVWGKLMTPQGKSSVWFALFVQKQLNWKTKAYQDWRKTSVFRKYETLWGHCPRPLSSPQILSACVLVVMAGRHPQPQNGHVCSVESLYVWIAWKNTGDRRTFKDTFWFLQNNSRIYPVSVCHIRSSIATTVRHVTNLAVRDAECAWNVSITAMRIFV